MNLPFSHGTLQLNAIIALLHDLTSETVTKEMAIEAYPTPTFNCHPKQTVTNTTSSPAFKEKAYEWPAPKIYVRQLTELKLRHGSCRQGCFGPEIPISLPEALRVLFAQRKQNGTSVPPKTGHVKLNFTYKDFTHFDYTATPVTQETIQSRNRGIYP